MIRNDEASVGVDARTEHTSFLSRLAEKLGGSAGAQTVYGEAVERDGVTVIPVAKVAYGFGGGSAGEGEGGGGGVQAMPLGFIEIENGRASYRRIGFPSGMAALLMAGGLAGAMLLRGVYNIVKGAGDARR